MFIEQKLALFFIQIKKAILHRSILNFTYVIFINLLVFLAISFSSCSKKTKYQFQNTVIGTIATITFVSTIKSNDAKKIANKLWNEVHRLDLIFSNYKKNSELSLLNQYLNSNKYSIPYKISQELYDVLKISKKVYIKTRGAFNIAVFPVVKLWKQKLKQKQIPTKQELQKIKNIVSLDNITIKNNTIFAKLKGSSLDLGGIAKGYIIDKLAYYLERHKITNYLIDIGGDIIVSGSKFDKAWKINLKNPNLNEKNRPYLAKCEFKNKKIAIATSGSYYRYTELNGIKYSHIINSKTLRPSKSDITSTTIIGQNATLVDAYATALYTMMYTDALKFLDKSNFNGIILSKRGEYEKKTTNCNSFVNFLFISSALDSY